MATLIQLNITTYGGTVSISGILVCPSQILVFPNVIWKTLLYLLVMIPANILQMCHFAYIPEECWYMQTRYI